MECIFYKGTGIYFNYICSSCNGSIKIEEESLGNIIDYFEKFKNSEK